MKTSDHTPYDYGPFVQSRLTEMKTLREEDRAKLFKISRSLEEEYGIPWAEHGEPPPIRTAKDWKDFEKQRVASCGRCAHQALVFELWALMNTKSVVQVVDGNLKIPQDQPKVVDVAEYVSKAAEGLRAFKQLIDKLKDNETLRAMIGEADKDATFADDIWKYSDLRLLEVLELAETIKGTRGQPQNPDWVPKFVELCRSFWANNMSGGARPIPHLAHSSKVTEWAETLYKELHSFGDLKADMAQFETAAKKLTKK